MDSLDAPAGHSAAMRDDIFSCIQRKRSMMVLMPMRDQMLRDMVSNICRESQSARKRALVLTPPGWVRKVTEMAIEAGRPGTVVGIDPSSLVCQAYGGTIPSSATSIHCKPHSGICPYQTGFSIELYRRLKGSAGSTEGIDPAEFDASGMCPLRTVLDLSSEMEVIVSEHSLLFSVGSEALISSMGVEQQETILAIMDPVALIESIWEERSYTLTMPQLQTDHWPLQGLPLDRLRALQTVFDSLREMIESTENNRTVERKVLFDLVRRSLSSEGLDLKVHDITAGLYSHLIWSKELGIGDRMKLSYLHEFLNTWNSEHGTVVRYVRRESESSITISLVAPQVLTSVITGAFHASIVFGDTVYPHDVLTRILGLTINKVNNRTYIDKGDVSDLTVVALTNMDLSHRTKVEEQFRTCARNIERIAGEIGGRILAVFPSYIALDAVADLLSVQGRRVIKETKGARREERESLVGDMMAGEGCIGLGVQGGTMANRHLRGELTVDLPIVVGFQMNPGSPEVRQRRLYFNENYGPSVAEMVSLILPAAQKAMRVVNAQMSSESMNRMVVLMDRRYHDRKNMDAIPPFWNVKFIDDPDRFSLSRLTGGS